MSGVRRLKRAALIVALGAATAVVRLQAEDQLEPPQPEPATSGSTSICYPDGRDGGPAADALQGCIDGAPAFSIIEIPAGRYFLAHQIIVSRPMTLRTVGAPGTLSCVTAPTDCAVLVAAPDLLDQWGPIVVRSTANVRLEHLVIDGNRSARTASDAGHFCLNGDNSYGYNASVLECERCGLEDVVSRNALCGSGMVWTGGQASIEHSAFLSNGDAATKSMWADGMTLLHAPRSIIRDNVFADNSDVALIVGHGVDTRVEHNTIVQRTQPAFAGLMLDTFNSNDRNLRGDFRGAVIAHNTVDCGPQLCTFGIQVGPRPWYATSNIVGGEVHDNAVTGAKIGINVDGAGERDAPTAIFNNRVEAAPAGSYFAECAQPIPADWMNVAPTSIVDRRNERTSVGSHLSDWCQLWSNLSTDP